MSEFKPELEYIIDDEGYPTPAYLESIRSWPHESGYNNLMDYVARGWWNGNSSISKSHRVEKEQFVADIFRLSTGGWSGNEDIIAVLHGNALFYIMCWHSSQKGGHYKYEIKRKKDGTKG